MEKDETIMSVRDVARAAGRSEETVRRWIWSGKLPATKLGNQLFVRKQDLEAMQAPRLGEAAVKYRTRLDSVFENYGYSAFGGALDEARGQYIPTSYEEAQNIVDDEAFQDEVLAKFGRVNIVELLNQVRDG
jgi:excisionase family DNA binding protein